MAAYFDLADNGALVPRPDARGPWAADMLHGRLLGGIAARALEAELGEPGWRAARLTVDLFRPAGMEPVTCAVEPVRSGRKVRVGDAVLSAGDHVVGRVTGLFLVTDEDPPGEVWRRDHAPWPDPETIEPPDIESADDDGQSRSPEHWLVRPVHGEWNSFGQSAIWSNDTADLVEGESLSPLVRAAMSSDIACPLTNSGSDGLHYINADYTLALTRYPQGSWVGIEAADQVQADGLAVTVATMRDQTGVFGFSTGASLRRPPFEF